jgi:hypothetical protein
MTLRSPDFESGASASFTTPAMSGCRQYNAAIARQNGVASGLFSIIGYIQ